MAALRLSIPHITQGDKDKKKSTSEPFMVKAVLKSLNLIIEEHKSVELWTMAVWLYSNLICSGEIDSEFIFENDVKNIVDLLKFCNETDSQETFDLSDRIFHLIGNLLVQFRSTTYNLLKNDLLEHLSFGLDKVIKDRKLNDSSIFHCLRNLGFSIDISELTGM
jgi:hypothetical protein